MKKLVNLDYNYLKKKRKKRTMSNSKTKQEEECKRNNIHFLNLHAFLWRKKY